MLFVSMFCASSDEDKAGDGRMCRRSKWMLAAAVVAAITMCLVPTYFVLGRGSNRGGYYPWVKQETAGNLQATTSASLEGKVRGASERKNATQRADAQSIQNKPSTQAAVSSMTCCSNLANLDKDKVLTIGHRRKQKDFLTIGIPYPSQKGGQNNLKWTLESLIQNIRDKLERSQVTIVVFTSALDQGASQQAHDVVSGFPEQVESGLLQLIEAPKSFYPDLGSAPLISDRTKTNLDGALLLTYAAGSSDFYLQLVDNVSAPPNYLQSIRDFINQQEGAYWVALEFLPSGFSGKLIRGGGRDMQQLVHLLTEYNKERPIDSLFSYFKTLNVQQGDFVRRPPLFLFW